MIRLLCIIALLTGCATQPHVYSSGPGVVYDGQQFWIGEVSEAEREAWRVEHLQTPVFDEQEREALRWCEWGSAADLTTTAIGLFGCSALREVNPVWAWMPPGAAIAANAGLSWMLCQHWRAEAEASPLADSRWRNPERFGEIRAGVGLWNAGQIVGCL